MPDWASPTSPPPRSSAPAVFRRRPTRPLNPSRPILKQRPRLELGPIRSDQPDHDPMAQNLRYRFGPLFLLKSPPPSLISTRSPGLGKTISSLVQIFTRTPLNFMRFSSDLGVLYVHAIVVTRRIVLDQFCLLFLCNVVLFLSFCLCLHVCVCSGLCFGVAIVSRR